MELSLVHNDPTRTLLVGPTGPKYQIDTPRDQPGAPTTIVRVECEDSRGLVNVEIGRVEHHEAYGTRLQLCATNLELAIRPLEATETENSWSFTGPDNRPYKWQIYIQSPVLILDGTSPIPLARYRRAKLGIVSRSRRAFLEISPAGIGSVDLIVVTFVSFMKQRVAIDYHTPT